MFLYADIDVYDYQVRNSHMYGQSQFCLDGNAKSQTKPIGYQCHLQGGNQVDDDDSTWYDACILIWLAYSGSL